LEYPFFAEYFNVLITIYGISALAAFPFATTSTR
jgi:hypothetical protein